MVGYFPTLQTHFKHLIHSLTPIKNIPNPTAHRTGTTQHNTNTSPSVLASLPTSRHLGVCDRIVAGYRKPNPIKPRICGRYAI